MNGLRHVDIGGLEVQRQLENPIVVRDGQTRDSIALWDAPPHIVCNRHIGHRITVRVQSLTERLLPESRGRSGFRRRSAGL